MNSRFQCNSNNTNRVRTSSTHLHFDRSSGLLSTRIGSRDRRESGITAVECVAGERVSGKRVGNELVMTKRILGGELCIGAFVERDRAICVSS